MVTQERLREVLSYNLGTGEFIWSVDRKKCSAGAVAGSRRADGYVTIRIDYRRYYAHRLAWLYVTGEWPDIGIDHADGNPTNNAWSNLRLADPAQNTQNRGIQRNNSLGIKGVRRSGKRFYAIIQAYGRSIYLGSFPTAAQAKRAYDAAAKRYHGEFARAA